MKINDRKHKQDYQYSISLKLHIIIYIRGICRRTYLSTQNGIIFYVKINSACKVAFDMPTNVGPTYGMYFGPSSYQRCMSNMCYVGATLRPHVGPTMAQWANLRWANVVCQRWANGNYHAIWKGTHPVSHQYYPFHRCMACFIGLWPVSCVYGPFQMCKDAQLVQRCMLSFLTRHQHVTWRWLSVLWVFPGIYIVLMLPVVIIFVETSNKKTLSQT